MMDDTPNYANLSLKELEDVKRCINKQNYPERYHLVIEEIAKREQQPTITRQEISKQEQQWHSIVRKLYSTLFAIVCAVGLTGGVAHIWIYNHGSKKPTATHTQRFTGLRSHQPVVYITPTSKTVDRVFGYFLMPGIPILFGLYFILHFLVGINLSEKDTENTPKKPF